MSKFLLTLRVTLLLLVHHGHSVKLTPNLPYNTLLETCEWPDNHLTNLDTHFGSADITNQCVDSLNHATEDGWTVTTAFSGVDTPIQALEGLGTAFERRTGKQLKVVNCAAVEKYGPSITELKLQPLAPRCIFQDIQRFLTPSVSARIRRKLGSYSFEALK